MAHLFICASLLAVARACCSRRKKSLLARIFSSNIIFIFRYFFLSDRMSAQVRNAFNACDAPWVGMK
jgi:hypothetical protein